ncbi:MAG: DegT/DnrJ/EryC1/StrS family aminotransferase [Candidatus Acidiferrales bacterium]
MSSHSSAADAPIPLLDLRAEWSAIGPEIRVALERVLASQQWILGSEGEALEREIAQLCGSPTGGSQFGVGVASGTDALTLALHASGVGAGDDVIVPAFTFIATASAVSSLGARPVFADIEPDSFGLDPARIEERLTARTRAIVAVHLFGQSAQMDPILALGARRGIAIIEDNAQSLGARYHGRATGSMGAFGCLSFYPSKNLGAYGDGGMILTASAANAERLRGLRNHGETTRYVSAERGWNSRLDEIQAAALRVKLRHLAQWTAARQAIARAYNSALGGLAGISTPQIRSNSEHVYSVYTVRVEGGVARRDRVKQHLASRGITSVVYYPVPLHLQPLYAATQMERGALPESERAANEVLSLPIYPGLTEAQIERVARAVTEALHT